MRVKGVRVKGVRVKGEGEPADGTPLLVAAERAVVVQAAVEARVSQPRAFADLDSVG